MNESELVITAVCAALEAGSATVLASIIGSQGALPRHRGSKMVVSLDERIAGTVGGGAMEAETIAQSKAALAQRNTRWLHFDLAGDDASSAGPVCGGTATLLLDFVAATRENADFFRWYRDNLSAGRDLYTVTLVRDEAGVTEVLGRSLLLRYGSMKSTFDWPPEDLQRVRAELYNVKSTAILSLGAGRAVIEAISRPKTVYCFGAGHVALATARLATQAGFIVNVIDDRAEYATKERFSDASVRAVASYDRVLEDLPVDSDSFIIILTHGHQQDETVLEQALRTDAGYIGMIGSRRKRDLLFAALAARGATKAQLERVHSPIGLAIDAETPDEIAVSIVAELIQERARQRRLPRRWGVSVSPRYRCLSSTPSRRRPAR